jgi:hypothetical protein
MAVRQQLSGPGLALFAARDGHVRRLADDEPSPPGCHQHWLLDESAGVWRADVMVEAGDASLWVYRRDARVSEARERMIGRTPTGIPYLKPHGALLYKAKSTRPKDDADFQMVVARMSSPDREWLRAALELVYPDHPWLGRLRSVEIEPV